MGKHSLNIFLLVFIPLHSNNLIFRCADDSGSCYVIERTWRERYHRIPFITHKGGSQLFKLVPGHDLELEELGPEDVIQIFIFARIPSILDELVRKTLGNFRVDSLRKNIIVVTKDGFKSQEEF